MNPQSGAGNPQFGAAMGNSSTSFPAGLLQGSNSTNTDLTVPQQTTANNSQPQIRYTPAGLAYTGNADFRGYVAAQGGDIASLDNFIGGSDANNPYTVNPSASPAEQQKIKDAYSNFQQNVNMNPAVNYNPNAGTTDTAVTSGTSTGLSPLASAQLSSAIKASYTNPIKSYINELMVTDPQNYGVEVSNANALASVYSQQGADKSQGIINTYAQQQAGNTASQKLSLAQLADSIRGQNQGFQNSLGNTGAGSSSAVEMGEYAFGKQQAKEQSAINLNTAVNNQNLQAQINAELQNGIDVQNVLAIQKKQSLQSIFENYQKNFIGLSNSLSSAIGQQARDQIYYTKTALDQDTLNQLNNLDQNISTANTAYQNAISSGTTTSNAATMTAAPTAPAATLPLPSANFQGNTKGLSEILNS